MNKELSKEIVDLVAILDPSDLRIIARQIERLAELKESEEPLPF